MGDGRKVRSYVLDIVFSVVGVVVDRVSFRTPDFVDEAPYVVERCEVCNDNFGRFDAGMCDDGNRPGYCGLLAELAWSRNGYGRVGVITGPNNMMKGI